MNITKIKNELKRKSENELTKFQFIGAEIKNCRLKLSKTLDSISNVNKSISYISKIENNKIVPNKESLMELCTELMISNDDLKSMNNFDETLIVVLEAVYRDDSEMIENSFSKYSNFTNVRTQLMNGIYYFYKEDYTNLEKTIELLSKVETCLSVDDYLIYILLYVKILLYKKANLKAFKIIRVIEETNVGKIEILRLIKGIKFNLKLGFGITICEHDFNEIIGMHLKYYNLKEIDKVTRLYKEQQIELSSLENIEYILNTITDKDLLCLAYLKLNDLEGAKRNFYLGLDAKIVIYYHFKNNDVKSLNEIITNNNNIDKHDLIIANLYKIRLEGNDELLKDYLLNTCVPYFSDIAKINMLLEVSNELYALNAKSSKYKESCNIAIKISNLTQEIIQTLL